MTRKDFELIASTIRGFEPFVRLHIADEFATALASTNPRFDRARFLAACVPPISTNQEG